MYDAEIFFSTQNSNTENLQQSQCHIGENAQNPTNSNSKNKFQQHIYIKQYMTI